jgi:hypothetical protein
MLNTQFPEEVRDALLTYHIVQDDLLDVQVLLDVIATYRIVPGTFRWVQALLIRVGRQTTSVPRKSSGC